MFKLMNRCALLALFPFFAACNGDNAPGVLFAGGAVAPHSQSERPAYYKTALTRAAQLSSSPDILVAICESDAKAQGHANNSLADYVYQCVENAGME